MTKRRKSEYSREELEYMKYFVSGLQNVFGEGNIIKGLMGYAPANPDKHRQPECGGGAVTAGLNPDDEDFLDFSRDPVKAQ